MTHAFFSGGFRPMFLGAALWAALSMLLWIGLWAGVWDAPMALDPLDWHVHEMLFGYGGAVLAGFLLTAVPNWTKRPPLTGAPLVALSLLWLAGRLAGLGPWGWPTALLDLSFLALLGGVMTRDIVIAGNRRNLPVVGMVGLLWLANLLFYRDVIQGQAGFDGAGTRMGVAVLIGLICLIGGRIIPAFTTNWLKAQSHEALPRPFGQADAAILLASAAGLTLWVITPSAIAGLALIGLSGAHLWRLSRWCGWATRSEALIAALHLAYGFIPLGFALTGLALMGAPIPVQAGLHAWTVGAIGGMTLTVMIRATLGHSGLPLQAGRPEVAFLLLILVAALTRILSGLGLWDMAMMQASAVMWAAGFALFALRYAPVMVTPRMDAA